VQNANRTLNGNATDNQKCRLLKANTKRVEQYLLKVCESINQSINYFIVRLEVDQLANLVCRTQ